MFALRLRMVFGLGMLGRRVLVECAKSWRFPLSSVPFAMRIEREGEALLPSSCSEYQAGGQRLQQGVFCTDDRFAYQRFGKFNSLRCATE